MKLSEIIALNKPFYSASDIELSIKGNFGRELIVNEFFYDCVYMGYLCLIVAKYTFNGKESLKKYEEHQGQANFHFLDVRDKEYYLMEEGPLQNILETYIINGGTDILLFGACEKGK